MMKTKQAQYRRVLVETSAGLAAAAAAVVTIVIPDWIERLSGLEPDGGDGSMEWGVVLSLAAISVASCAMAWRDWQRLERA